LRARREHFQIRQFRRVYDRGLGRFLVQPGEITLMQPSEVDEVSRLFDRFLDGRGFIPKGIIRNLATKKEGYIYILRHESEIVAVAVGRKGGTLWNLLVHPAWRRKGLGEAFIKFLSPDKIRVKCTAKRQISDPTGFYEKLGYRFVEYVVPRNVWAAGKYKKVGAEATITIMRKGEG
jgi:GNAT superfamily N-acetyltransferase